MSAVLVATAAWAGTRWHSGTHTLAPPQARTPKSVVITGMLPNILGESSGIATSRRFAGVLWTHNDSGDEPVIYAIDKTGRVLASFVVTGAQLDDWEDIAIMNCPDRERQHLDCLYIADTGDNLARRAFVTVYVVPEPDPTAAGGSRAARTEPTSWIRVVYPDGAHDVEAMSVSPEGEILFFTKGRSGPIQAYAVSRSAALDHVWESSDPVTATHIGSLSFGPMRFLGRLVTGAAHAPNGNEIVLRTYTELHFYERTASGRLEVSAEPCFFGAIEPQGEAVDFLDDARVILTSETLRGRPGTIHEVEC